MQRQPLTGQKLVVHRLLQEAVAELHDLVIAGKQQLAIDCLPQGRGELRLLHLRHRCQDVVPCGLTGHGDHSQEIPGRIRESTDPGQQRLAKREADALLASLRDGEELLREEGVPAAAVVEPRDKGAIGRTAENARQLVMDFVACEGRELEAIHLPAPSQLGEQVQKRMPLVQLVGAVRPDQHHATLGQVSYQEAQQVAGGPIRPMQVLQRNDGHGIGGNALDQSKHLEVKR